MLEKQAEIKKLKVDFFQISKRSYKKILIEGYAEFDDEKLSFLEIEYKIDGFGTEEDLDKRHRLESELDEILGWTGLGHTDGGSIGSGTMEAACLVVDFDIAKKVIEKKLRNTEFADYTRIFEMSMDES